MNRYLFSLLFTLFLGLTTLTASAQFITVDYATPDINGNGELDSNEFGTILVSGSFLNTATSATLEQIGTGLSCNVPIQSATATQLMLDVSGCNFYPDSGTFLVTSLRRSREQRFRLFHLKSVRRLTRLQLPRR